METQKLKENSLLGLDPNYPNDYADFHCVTKLCIQSLGLQIVTN